MEEINPILIEIKKRIESTQRELRKIKKVIEEMKERWCGRENEMESNLAELSIEIELLEEGLREEGYLRNFRRSVQDKEGIRNEKAKAKKEGREESARNWGDQEDENKRGKYRRNGREEEKMEVTKNVDMEKKYMGKANTLEKKESRREALLITAGHRWTGQVWEKYISGVLGKKIKCTFERTTNEKKNWVYVESREIRKEIWDKREYIRREGIYYVDEYLTGRERAERHRLVEVGKEMRNRGEKVKVENKRIWIESRAGVGKWYVWEEEGLVVEKSRVEGRDDKKEEEKMEEEEDKEINNNSVNKKEKKWMYRFM